MADVSPLAPAAFPTMTPIAGVRLAASRRGHPLFRAQRSDGGRAGAGHRRLPASSRNRRCRASRSIWCRAMPAAAARCGRSSSIPATPTSLPAAPAGRSSRAPRRARRGCSAATASEVFISSTGVIGEPPPADRISARAARNRRRAVGRGLGGRAARAIMTTDTFPKGATATADDRRRRRCGSTGSAKGSGMIAPDMATMLGYVFTDAALPAPVLQPLLAVGDRAVVQFDHRRRRHLDQRHGAAVRDAAGEAPRRSPMPAIRGSADFRRALDAVMIDLAQQIARDGEGAGKFVTIEVTGAESDRAARRIGLTIGNSPLVKTALAAGDANWGRIVMAVGKAGEKADRDRLSISVGGMQIAAEGGPVPDYDEAPGRRAHEGPRNPHRRRYRHRPRQGDGVDLRSDPRLCRHQWQLPKLKAPRP